MVSQLLLRGVDGRTRVLRFDARCVAGSAVLAAAGAACALPAGAFRIVTGAAEVTPHASLSCDAAGLLPSATVLLRLRGGKGGFGSLLRGAGKGGRITENNDACRDLSGRRLRVTNAETKLKEWQAKSRERELEAIAEAHLKKVNSDAARVAQAARDAEAQLAAERAALAAALPAAVDRGLAAAEKLRAALKRKEAAEVRAVPRKRHCMWTLPSETGAEALSDDDAAEEEAEDGGAGPASAPQLQPQPQLQPASEPGAAPAPAPAPAPSPAPPAPKAAAAAAAEPAPPAAPREPVDLARFNSAAELEALGLEALKAELAARGLKCGGTLAERAARLFLLKSCSFDQLDAKHKAPPPKR